MRTRRGETSKLFPGIGPVTERRLIEVGIGDLVALRMLGAVQAYHRLKFRYGKDVTLNALYGIEAVLLGCNWLHLPAERKNELQREATALAPK